MLRSLFWYNSSLQTPVQASVTKIMKLTLQDYALRALLVVAGGLAAVMLTLKGHAEALPALALGATLGAVFMGRFGPSEE